MVDITDKEREKLAEVLDEVLYNIDIPLTLDKILSPEYNLPDIYTNINYTDKGYIGYQTQVRAISNENLKIRRALVKTYISHDSMQFTLSEVVEIKENNTDIERPIEEGDKDLLKALACSQANKNDLLTGVEKRGNNLIATFKPNEGKEYSIRFEYGRAEKKVIKNSNYCIKIKTGAFLDNLDRSKIKFFEESTEIYDGKNKIDLGELHKQKVRDLISPHLKTLLSLEELVVTSCDDEDDSLVKIHLTSTSKYDVPGILKKIGEFLGEELASPDN